MSTPHRLRGEARASGAPVADWLGPCLRSFRVDAARHVIWACAPFVLLLAYVVWLGHQGELLHWFNSTFSVGAVTTLFVLAVLLIGHTAAVGGAEVIRVHAAGLVDLRTGHAVRWDEVRSLTAVWDAKTRRVARHLLTTTAGGRISLSASIAAVDELLDEIRTRMVDHKLGSLRLRVAEGGSVRFGAFAVSAEGIATDQGRLAWPDVGRVDAEDGEVVVRTRDGERWAAAALETVPNDRALTCPAARPWGCVRRLRPAETRSGPSGPGAACSGSALDPPGLGLGRSGSVPDPPGFGLGRPGLVLDPSGPGVGRAGSVLVPSGPGLSRSGSAPDPSGLVLGRSGFVLNPSGPGLGPSVQRGFHTGSRPAKYASTASR
jgi:hypothetical protein